MTESKATFAAGCFWEPEVRFREIQGVVDAVVGYTGGHLDNPTYHDVCSGDTGHAEAILVTFDRDVVSYRELLSHFWAMHDPTTVNRQGPDIGTQYRSAIFVHDSEQREAAVLSREEQQTRRRDGRTIVTEICDAMTFWRAEDYHQKFFEKRRQRHGMARMFGH